ncbi:hypothetical protein ACIQPQ_26805 [Streptomyces sp. NPDC091281]|uniref:hypothetical protein n=1 Tax=Streptomyces sp. NPDC091281 TaxID=3365985 RepID=UPI003828FB9D
MNEDDSLERYGLRPEGDDLEEVRRLLRAHTERERRAQGDGDTLLMRLCCVQLFNAGHLDDVLLVWGAKTASMDAFCSIDVQLLCGAGLSETRAHLAAQDGPEAAAALSRVDECDEAGDFESFTAEEWSARYAEHYA